MSRGVLLDVARTLGHERLPGAYEISGADLERARERAGVTLFPGDVLPVQTVQFDVLKRGAGDAYSLVTPGIPTTAIEWLLYQQSAAVAFDPLPFEPFVHAQDQQHTVCRGKRVANGGEFIACIGAHIRRRCRADMLLG